MEYLVYIALLLTGLCLGSFAGASVWRLRARQLVQDKKDGEKVSAKELTKLTPLTKTTLLSDRSRCLHCGYELRWYDLIPVISWLSLGGKCRQCKKPIGWFELVIELGVSAFFVLSYVVWPFGFESWQQITQFILWLVSGVVLAILFAYDLKWFLLPDIASAILALLGGMSAVIVTLGSSNPIETALGIAASVGVLAGIYGLLYLVSKGRWIGFGDVKLGVGLGLLLIDWRLAIVALFAANLIGTLLVLPGMIAGKLKPGTRIPFGPLLIAGTVLAYLAGPLIVDWYTASLLL